MIQFVKGNFFDYDANIRVNTVNCVGVMGAGVALQFKNKYPAMFEEYVRECNLQRIGIGKPHVWVENNFFDRPTTIINLPTKNDWRKPSEYEYVEKGLVWLKEYLKDKKDIVTLPALGCGHGGLDWDKVKPMIIKYLNSVSANILVFEPESSATPNLKDIDKQLEDLNILKIEPNNNKYPTFESKSSKPIYLKGNPNCFKDNLFSIVVDPKADDREKIAIMNSIENIPSGNFTYLLSYNSGFEIDVVKAILEKNVRIVIIIPYGILNFKLRKDLKTLWHDDKVTIISLAKPNQSWSSYESLNAIKFRIKIANAILLTNLNVNTLIKLEKELTLTSASKYYLNYWNVKIDFFEKIHAFSIGRDKESKLPKVSVIFDHLDTFGINNY